MFKNKDKFKTQEYRACFSHLRKIFGKEYIHLHWPMVYNPLCSSCVEMWVVYEFLASEDAYK